MTKYQYTRNAVSKNRQDQGMSLLALLFLMILPVNVSGHLQGSDNQVTVSNDNQMTGLLKVGVLTMFLAAVIELLVI